MQERPSEPMDDGMQTKFQNQTLTLLTEGGSGTKVTKKQNRIVEHEIKHATYTKLNMYTK